MSRSTCAGIRECSASTSCGAKQDGRSCPEAVGGAPAPGFAGDAGSADRSPGAVKEEAQRDKMARLRPSREWGRAWAM